MTEDLAEYDSDFDEKKGQTLKRLSLDGGKSFLEYDDLNEHIDEIFMFWESIVNSLDRKTMTNAILHMDGVFSRYGRSEIEFLSKCLKFGTKDIIVGYTGEI